MLYFMPISIEILHMEIFLAFTYFSELWHSGKEKIDYASMMWIWCVGAMQLIFVVFAEIALHHDHHHCLDVTIKTNNYEKNET